MTRHSGPLLMPLMPTVTHGTTCMEIPACSHSCSISSFIADAPILVRCGQHIPVPRKPVLQQGDVALVGLQSDVDEGADDGNGADDKVDTDIDPHAEQQRLWHAKVFGL